MNEYIGNRFKWDFIARFCIGMAVISILSALFFLLVMPKGEATFYASLVYLVQRTEASLLPVILVVGIFETALALLFTLLLCLFLSHRVGGAIFKLERNVERLKSGDIAIQPMILRGTDQGQILAVKFNEMLRNWKASFRELGYYHGKISARVDLLHKGWIQSGRFRSGEIARIENDVEKMQATLDRFTV